MGRGWVEVGENVKVLQFMQLSKLYKGGFVIFCLLTITKTFLMG